MVAREAQVLSLTNARRLIAEVSVAEVFYAVQMRPLRILRVPLSEGFATTRKGRGPEAAPFSKQTNLAEL